jgi:adenosylhomocysteinase
MDMSFANQALSVEWIVRQAEALEAKVHDVPKHIDREVAKLKLAAMHVDIDQLTDEQRAYIEEWTIGT